MLTAAPEFVVPAYAIEVQRQGTPVAQGARGGDDAFSATVNRLPNNDADTVNRLLQHGPGQIINGPVEPHTNRPMLMLCQQENDAYGNVSHWVDPAERCWTFIASTFIPSEIRAHVRLRGEGEERFADVWTDLTYRSTANLSN